MESSSMESTSPYMFSDYPAKWEVIVVKKALEDQLIPGLFHKFKPYKLLTHRILDKFAVISTEALLVVSLITS